MGFKCGITGKHSGSNVKPVVVTYFIEKEYERGGYITKGREIVREVLALPDAAPKEREIFVPGLRGAHAAPAPQLSPREPHERREHHSV